MHPSIIKSEDQLESVIHSKAQFGCPLCPKFDTMMESTLRRHLDAHIRGAVHFKDTIICRCNQSCRDTGHYHCPFCARTILRKEDIIIHVTACQRTSGAVPPPCAAPLLVQLPSVPPSAESGPPVPLVFMFQETSAGASPHTAPKPEPEPDWPVSTSAVSVDHCYTISPQSSPVKPQPCQSPPASPPPPPSTPQPCQSPPASPPPPPSTPQPCQSPPASPPPGTPQSGPPPSASPPEVAALLELSSDEPALAIAPPETVVYPCSRPTYKKMVKCPQCSVVLYKKNLLAHLRRKHARPKAKAAASLLQSLCAEKTRDLFALPNGAQITIKILEAQGENRYSAEVTMAGGSQFSPHK